MFGIFGQICNIFQLKQYVTEYKTRNPIARSNLKALIFKAFLLLKTEKFSPLQKKQKHYKSSTYT